MDFIKGIKQTLSFFHSSYLTWEHYVSQEVSIYVFYSMSEQWIIGLVLAADLCILSISMQK